MPKRSMKENDPLEDFAGRTIALDGVTKIVHVAGTGPAVIVIQPTTAARDEILAFFRHRLAPA